MRLIVPFLAALLTAPAMAHAVGLQTLATLPSDTSGTLVVDRRGNLFGTTAYGTSSEFGTVFMLANGAHTATTLVILPGGRGGAHPGEGLITDAHGNLFGTTDEGGAAGQGTVFKLAKGARKLTILASFRGGKDGAYPNGGLLMDTRGNLFGTTSGGNGRGTVFKLAKGSHTVTTLARFPSAEHPDWPQHGLVADAYGNLFGTTFGSERSSGNLGTVFMLAKGSHTINTLARFTYDNGARPKGDLIADACGNLFGTTLDGGSMDSGTVFMLAKGSHEITTFASFPSQGGRDGSSGPLIADADGTLFGTSRLSGSEELVVVFFVTGQSQAAIVQARFTVQGSKLPRGNLVADSNGNLLGFVLTGDSADKALLFGVTDVGFVPRTGKRVPRGKCW